MKIIKIYNLELYDCGLKTIIYNFVEMPNVYWNQEVKVHSQYMLRTTTCNSHINVGYMDPLTYKYLV
jgi:hypothetical protein